MSSEAANKPICDLPTDGTCVSIDKLLNVGDCLIPAGSCFSASTVIVDKHGHPVDGDWKQDKNGEWVLNDGECEHENSPEYIAEHKKKEHKKKEYKKIMKKVEVKQETATEVATATETVTIVEQPKVDPVVPQKKEATPDATITLVVGMLSGIIGNAATPFLKSLLKKMFKKNAKAEEKNDEVTDCKTHQVTTNTKFSSLANRVAALENKTKEENDFGIDLDEINDLKDRIEKLEKKKK